MISLKVTVCDAMCGAGKTQAVINMMNNSPDTKFLFVTPRLTEVERIKQSCEQRNFVEPRIMDNTFKMGNLKKLLRDGHNIASTHALFRSYDDEVLTLVKEKHYTLVLDEIIDIVDILPMHPDDVRVAERFMSVDEGTGRVTWIAPDYRGSFFRDIRSKIEGGYVTLDQDHFLLWLLPIDIFQAFDDVLILTYMFDAQPQRYYYDLHNIPYSYVGVRHVGGAKYEFCDVSESTFHLDIANKVHIVDNYKLNYIGNERTSLSVSWFDKNARAEDGGYEEPSVERLRKNLVNYFSNYAKVSRKRKMWTTYKRHRKAIDGTAYSNGFLECRSRATNDFAERTHLAYCVNMYVHPTIKLFFAQRGITIDQDRYALSEMIQWVWRSAIRRGEEIWLYVPSSRMRELFQNWVSEQHI